MTKVAKARRRVKLSKDEILRRLRLGNLRRLFADRCRGSILPDDDAGREYLRELLLPISLGPHEAIKRPGAIQLWGPTDRMRREIELWAEREVNVVVFRRPPLLGKCRPVKRNGLAFGMRK